MRMIAVALVRLVGTSASPASAEDKITRSTKLTERNYPDIHKAILHRPSEEKWKEIPWRPNLAGAMEEARERDKPVLLWVMNGHPCGMT